MTNPINKFYSGSCPRCTTRFLGSFDTFSHATLSLAVKQYLLLQMIPYYEVLSIKIKIDLVSFDYNRIGDAIHIICNFPCFICDYSCGCINKLFYHYPLFFNLFKIRPYHFTIVFLVGNQSNLSNYNYNIA